MENVIIEHKKNNYLSFPRQYHKFSDSQLVFSIGGEVNKCLDIKTGCRIYSDATPADNQNSEVTLCFNDNNLQGIYIGTKLGEWRCGAIGGVALKRFINKSSEVLGVVGCGRQAYTQVLAATSVHKFKCIYIYCRNQRTAEKFKIALENKYNIRNISIAANEKILACESDVLITATNSDTPVIRAEWLKKRVHINNIGMKFKTQHELPYEVYKRSDLICTDTISQAHDLRDDFILANTETMRKLQPFEQITGDKQINSSIFISLGLAGTEVILAAELFRRVQRITT